MYALRNVDVRARVCTELAKRWDVHEILDTDGSFRRSTAVGENNGALRLTYDREQLLTLEVNHGPSPEEMTFGLDLFQSQCVDDVVGKDKRAPGLITFESAVENGLDLPDSNSPQCDT